MSLSLDTDRARAAFIDARKAVLASAEDVADKRARGVLTVAALDRLDEDVAAFQNARRKFVLLVPE